MQKQAEQVFVIPDSVEIEIESEIHQAGKREIFGQEHSWNTYTSETFVLSGKIRTQYLKKMFAIAELENGKYHHFHLADFGLKCWDSTPARHDYDDSIDCDAGVPFMKIQYKGNIFDVEGDLNPDTRENYGKEKKIYAYRQIPSQGATS